MLGMNGEGEGGEDNVLCKPLEGQLGAGFSSNPQHPTGNEAKEICFDDEAADDVEKSSDEQEGRPVLWRAVTGEGVDEGGQPRQ